MKIYRILYGALGAALLAGAFFTGDYGLSDENIKIYEDALALQEQVDELGFEQFNLNEYKVRFYDGNVDYVVKGNDVNKEEAVFTTFVGTTYKIDGEYQVILPTVENFAEMYKLLGTAGSLAEGEVNFTEDEYGSAEHIAALWHEAAHAYQMTYYQDEILSLIEGKVSVENIEDVIVSAVDSNEDVVKLYQKQMGILNKAYITTDLSEKKAYIESYLEMETERRELLDEEACAVEDYYEAAEGTARYIESHVYRFQEGQEAFEREYTNETEYQKGSGKYYSMGMLKCCLLDELNPGWKDNYDFSVTLTELLEAL